MNRITHPKNPKAEIRNNIIYWNMNKQPSYRKYKGPYPLDKDGNSTVPQIYEIDGKTLRNFGSIPEPGESLQDMRPDVAAEFLYLDSERVYHKQHGEAYLKPKDIKCGTNEYAWFKCSNPNCQHIWKATINSRTKRKYIKEEETQQYISMGYTIYIDSETGRKYVNTRINCPLCSNNKNESIYEEYLYQLLQPELSKRGFTLEKHLFLSRFDSNYVAGIKGQDYQMRQLMNFDFYIPQIRTFIDFNGGVHGIDNVVKTDNEKKTWAYNHGFNLIVITCGEIEASVPKSIEKSSHYIKYKIHRERKYSPNSNKSDILPGTKEEITWVAKQILNEIGSTCRPLYYNRVNNKYQIDSNMNNYYNNQVQERPIAFDKQTSKFKLRNDLR